MEVFTQGHPSFPKINLGLIIDSFASESCETRGFEFRGNVGGSCYDFKFTWIWNSGWDLGRGRLNTDRSTGKNTFKPTLVKCSCQWLKKKSSLKTLKEIKTHSSLLKVWLLMLPNIPSSTLGNTIFLGEKTKTEKKMRNMLPNVPIAALKSRGKVCFN